MPDAPTHDSPTERLAELEAELAAARERQKHAVIRRKHDRGLVEKQATAALVEFRDDVSFRRPGAVPEEERPARLRELTADLMKFMEEHGLVFQALGQRGGSLRVVDPSVDADAEAANIEVVAAQRAVREFREKHGDAIRAEEEAAEAARIREALAGDDPAAIREAISGRTGAGALTTADLA